MLQYYVDFKLSLGRYVLQKYHFVLKNKGNENITQLCFIPLVLSTGWDSSLFDQETSNITVNNENVPFEVFEVFVNPDIARDFSPLSGYAFNVTFKPKEEVHIEYILNFGIEGDYVKSIELLYIPNLSSWNKETLVEVGKFKFEYNGLLEKIIVDVPPNTKVENGLVFSYQENFNSSNELYYVFVNTGMRYVPTYKNVMPYVIVFFVLFGVCFFCFVVFCICTTVCFGVETLKKKKTEYENLVNEETSMREVPQIDEKKEINKETSKNIDSNEEENSKIDGNEEENSEINVTFKV